MRVSLACLKLVPLWLLLIFSSGQGNVNEMGVILEKCGDMEFSYEPLTGMKLSIFGIPIIKGSYFAVVSPGWKENYFNTTLAAKDFLQKARIEPLKGGKKFILPFSSTKDSQFSGKQTFILLQDNTFTTTLEFNFQKQVPAIFEWKVGGIPPEPIIGCSYIATVDQFSKKGAIPLTAVGSGVEESMIARKFKSINIDSRLGPIEISTQPKQDFAFFDYRKNKWAERDNPIFWLGLLERQIISGKDYSYSITLHFPKKLTTMFKRGEKKTMKVAITKVDDAQIPNWEQDYILPTPKHLIYTEALFPLSSKTKIYVGKNPEEGIENALDFFLKDLKELYQIELEVIREEFPQINPPQKAIVIGEVTRYPAPAKLLEEAKLKIPENDEGYSLFVKSDLVCVAAKKGGGIFYALVTLLQLCKVTEKGIFLKGAEIIDYPALKFRGIHCLSGKNRGEEIASAIRTLLARFKINSLIWECEYLKWDSHPEIEHPEYGMQKVEAQKVIEAARKYFIELIPLVQSLGHSEWIFTNGEHLDLAEDPETPYAYCPTNPETYKFIFSVYQEALDFFKPRYFHIGHDEITMRGRFPYRSKASGKSVTELIMEDIHKLYAWFSKRGVKIMLWGDMFLWEEEATDAAFAPSPEEAKKRRQLLPRDVTICDWHYAEAQPEEYKSLRLFKDEGFKTIAAAWFRPDNIRNLAKACLLYDAEGFLQTTWAGFNFKITGNEREWHQYWAWLWAAQYGWTGENTPSDELPFNASQLFLDLWFERKPLLKKRSGFTLDLKALYNRRLKDDEQKTGWLGYGPDCDFSALPLNQSIFGETKFKIEENRDGEGAILLAGKMNPKGNFQQSVEILLDETPVVEMHFLVTASFRTSAGHPVGEIIFNYSDATTDTLKLIYGKNLFAFNDEQGGSEARIVWQGRCKNGQRINLREVVWNNPHPEKKMVSLLLHSTVTEAAPIILAITSVN